MHNIIESPLFGIVVCIVTFQIGLLIQQKLKAPAANPLLIAIVLTITLLKVFDIPLETFQTGGNIINMMLGPLTVLLAITIYRQFKVLKENFWPIVLGCLAGSITSMISAYLLCRLFGLDQQMTASLIPKSVTTPIAIEISTNLGGIPSITVAAVIITGILGSILAPTLIKLFKVDSSVAAGVAIGTCSHAVGTTKAIQLGEIEGAMSGVAIGIAGLLTTFLALLL